jgi:hypothetical protein
MGGLRSYYRGNDRLRSRAGAGGFFFVPLNDIRDIFGTRIFLLRTPGCPLVFFGKSYYITAIISVFYHFFHE